MSDAKPYIAGIIIGGLALVALIACIVYFVRKHSIKQNLKMADQKTAKAVDALELAQQKLEELSKIQGESAELLRGKLLRQISVLQHQVTQLKQRGAVRPNV